MSREPQTNWLAVLAIALAILSIVMNHAGY
jgi:hypothetical protein